MCGLPLDIDITSWDPREASVYKVVDLGIGSVASGVQISSGTAGMLMSRVNSGGVEFMRHIVFLSPVCEWNQPRIRFPLEMQRAVVPNETRQRESTVRVERVIL